MKKNPRAEIRYFLYTVIVLNLVTLAVVFIYPRGAFLRAHAGLTFAQRMAAPGAPDMPNQYAPAYEVLNRIKGLTEEEATLYLPPPGGKGWIYSAAYQRLLPRKIVWGDAPGFWIQLKSVRSVSRAFFVFHPGWYPDFCMGKPITPLNDTGWGLCLIGSPQDGRISGALPGEFGGKENVFESR